MDLSLIGQRIQSHRKRKGLSQAELAVCARISTYHMGSIETGTRGPSLHVLIDTATVLDVTTDELLFGNRRSAKPPYVREISSLLGKCSAYEQSVLNCLLHATCSILHDSHHLLDRE